MEDVRPKILVFFYVLSNLWFVCEKTCLGFRMMSKKYHKMSFLFIFSERVGKKSPRRACFPRKMLLLCHLPQSLVSDDFEDHTLRLSTGMSISQKVMFSLGPWSPSQASRFMASTDWPFSKAQIDDFWATWHEIIKLKRTHCGTWGTYHNS